MLGTACIRDSDSGLGETTTHHRPCFRRETPFVGTHILLGSLNLLERKASIKAAWRKSDSSMDPKLLLLLWVHTYCPKLSCFKDTTGDDVAKL